MARYKGRGEGATKHRLHPTKRQSACCAKTLQRHSDLDPFTASFLYTSHMSIATLEVKVTTDASGADGCRIMRRWQHSQRRSARPRLLPLTASRPPIVLFDCTDLRFISSLLIGHLVEFQRGLARHGGKVRLSPRSPACSRSSSIRGSTPSLRLSPRFTDTTSRNPSRTWGAASGAGLRACSPSGWKPKARAGGDARPTVLLLIQHREVFPERGGREWSRPPCLLATAAGNARHGQAGTPAPLSCY